MDTISGSVSTLKIPAAAALHPKSHHLHHFNRHFHHHHHQPHLIISSSTPTNYSKLPNNNKTNTTAAAFTTTTSTAVAHSNNFTTNNNNPPFVSRQSSSKPEESLHHHRKASTGYAVALLDAARAHNVLELAKRDVRKLSKWLSNEQLSSIIENPCVEKKEKGEILRELMKRGKLYYKHLGKLVNLLVEKNKVEMLKDVLLEFQRMYDELSISSISSNHAGRRPQVVLVPCDEMKMEEHEIVGIAQRIQKITGADKIVVRQLLR